MENGLSTEEAQLYDRQLRLWGVQSQQRLQQSRVALIGFNSLQSETCKNIVLAGLNEITLIDWVIVQPEHTIPHLFLDPKTSIGQNRVVASKSRVSELNPLVRVTSVPVSSPEEAINYIKDQTKFTEKGFDLVIASELSLPQLCQLNQICRQLTIPKDHQLKLNVAEEIERSLPFIACGSFGMLSYFFLDLGNYVYTLENSADGGKAISTSVQKYNTMKEALEYKLTKPWDMHVALAAIHACETSLGSKLSLDSLPLLKKERDNIIKQLGLESDNLVSDEMLEFVLDDANMLRCYQIECNPVCAIMGGLIGQEVIKTLSASHSVPFNNFFFFNAYNGKNQVIKANDL